MKNRDTKATWQTMKAKNGFLMLLMVLLCGCDIVSSEKFIAPSAKSVELASHNGVFWIVPGNAVVDGQPMGPSENLLYVLIVCPKLAAARRGTTTNCGQRSNVYISYWETQQGKVSVPVNWNKVTDTVTIGKKRFDRSAGSAFVIIQQDDGKLVATQLPSPGPDVDARRALKFIQENMKDDFLIQSIRLPG